MTALSASSSSPPEHSNPLPATPAQGPLGVGFHEVGRRYGALWALRRVTLIISAGEFVLLRGPNGSGKSTLLRIAATLVKPSAGQTEYPGANASPHSVKSRIGYVAHSALLYDELSAAENLQFFGSLYGLPSLQARTEQALHAVGLADRRDGLVRTFSRGMRQRLSLARALLHGPGLLLLDEPMTGLDEEARGWLARALASLRNAGCTVLMSTHADETATQATRTVWLHAGQVVRDSTQGVPVRPGEVS